MTEIEIKIAKKTLDVLKKKSWNSLTVSHVIKINNEKKTKISSKLDLLKNINRYVDDILINKMKSIENSSTKDMLFEVLMARFEEHIFS